MIAALVHTVGTALLAVLVPAVMAVALPDCGYTRVIGVVGAAVAAAFIAVVPVGVSVVFLAKAQSVVLAVVAAVEAKVLGWQLVLLLWWVLRFCSSCCCCCPCHGGNYGYYYCPSCC